MEVAAAQAVREDATRRRRSSARPRPQHKGGTQGSGEGHPGRNQGIVHSEGVLHSLRKRLEERRAAEDSRQVLADRLKEGRWVG